MINVPLTHDENERFDFVANCISSIRIEIKSARRAISEVHLDYDIERNLSRVDEYTDKGEFIVALRLLVSIMGERPAAEMGLAWKHTTQAAMLMLR